ncbi:unnamed protein product [Peniophora sp. CBMAI 1063]|nr:unnamed protein product [Peniophora sp. CBMAI 1063]
MFSLPQGSSSGSQEGTTETNTIALPMLTREHVLVVEIFLFRNRNLYLLGNFERLKLLLHVADAWDFDEARDYVRVQLPRCAQWSTVIQLTLALRYHEDVWFRVAFEMLVWQKASDLLVNEREMLGHAMLRILDTARESIDDHRKILACSRLPYMPGPECSKPAGQCEAVLAQAWSDVGPNMLCSPVGAIRGRDIVEKLDQILTSLTEICGGCQVHSLDYIRMRRQFIREDEILEDCVTEAWKL